MHDITKSFLGKKFFRSTKPINCNVTDSEKFIDMISILQLTFKELQLVNFWYIKEDCMQRFDFLMFFNQNSISQQIECRSLCDNVGLFFIIKPDIKEV